MSGHPGSVGFQNRGSLPKDGFLHRGSSLSEGSHAENTVDNDEEDGSVSPPAVRQGVPIQR